MDELKNITEDVQIIWRAFELRPEPSPLPDANSDRFKVMWEQNIYPLAEQIGVEIEMPSVKPYSRITHEASKWAGSVGKFDEYRTAIFRAYFQEDKNIGELETLLEIAENLDLSKPLLKNALEENNFLEEVLDDEFLAEAIGISGVPAFIADRKSGLRGLQGVESLSHLIESVKAN